MKIVEVQRLCPKCMEEEGIVQPMFYEEDGKIKMHIHRKKAIKE